MELGLSGKIALVTGSSRGIGKAIATALAIEGATLVVCGRNEENLNSVSRKLFYVSNMAIDVYYFCVDARNGEEIRGIFRDSLWENFGRLDILVNNVGGPLKFGKFEDLTDEDWLNDWNFNLMSAVRFTRAALPLLKASGDGRIINISSVSGHQPGRFNPHHGTAKAAVEILTKYLANDLAKDNILVNAIRPNTLEGGGWHANVADRANRDKISLQVAANLFRAEELKKMPLQRMGTPEDVANLVLFLASDKAKYITGTVINVDGGTVRTV